MSYYVEMWAQDAAVMADRAGAALASPNTGVVPAAADGEMCQALSSQAAAFHAQFIQALDAASDQYASTETAY